MRLRWRQQECRSQPPWSHLASHQRQFPLQQRAASRPTGDRTGRVDHTRATGITRNGARAGTTATQHPVGCRRSAGRHLRTGPHLQAGIHRQAGHRRQAGSGLVPDHFSTCCTPCAVHSLRPEPASLGAGSGVDCRIPMIAQQFGSSSLTTAYFATVHGRCADSKVSTRWLPPKDIARVDSGDN